MTPVILLHGWGFGPAVWDQPGFMLDGRVAPALPGYGVTPRGVAAAGSDYLEQVTALLNTELPPPVTPAILVGWSLGALVAIALAQQYPAQIRGLVLVAGLPCFQRSGNWPAGWSEAELRQVREQLAQNPDNAWRYVAALAAHGDTKFKQVRAQLRATTMPASAVLQAGLMCLQQTDLRQVLAALAVPVSGLFGGRDAMLGADAAATLKSLRPDARVSVWPSAGHAPHLHDPAGFAGYLQNEINSL
ncbi:MAG: alpha/beta fold hydrolase [Gammaproteobacteria bacterium]